MTDRGRLTAPAAVDDELSVVVAAMLAVELDTGSSVSSRLGRFLLPEHTQQQRRQN